MATTRKRRGGFPFVQVFVIVVGIHVVGGLGVLWLAKTSTGQQLMKTYNIKLFEPPKPQEQQQAEKPPPPPPPPPPKQDALPPPPAPQAASVAAAAPAAPGPTVGGGGGTNWSGGKFVGADLGSGPEGAFHAAVTGLFRKHFAEPPEDFGPAELELSVSGTGSVIAYRLKRSSGSAKHDEAILAAAARVKGEGVGTPPPESRARVVTVRFTPSS